ncbi:MAG: cbb3-type cytochrome c oxidase subunit I, partial [Alphaproteobacteria bacterium]|nr:cbb3-type cytochrome c oxidase subunit I [Alphaproteobacteria bacterium]
TMGVGGDINAVFGILSMIIAIPTGVKIYNWLFTMYGGRIEYRSPMLWAVGFMITFLIGGMTGVLLAVPPADFVLHNSLFLVAHFHNVIIGGVLFGAFAGYTYWFPKAFGFTLDERLGKAAFWLWLVGFYVAFMPLYVLGLMGMTRRLQHFDRPEWFPWVEIAGVGALIVLCAITCQVAQLVVSIRSRERRRDLSGDPWDGRTLEWSTPSPPPSFNYPQMPEAQSDEPYWTMKQQAPQTLGIKPADHYEEIEMPRNSPTGFITAFFASVTGFAVIWHIWWLVILGLVGAYATFVWFAWQDVYEVEIPAAEVERVARANLAARQQAHPTEAAA